MNVVARRRTWFWRRLYRLAFIIAVILGIIGGIIALADGIGWIDGIGKIFHGIGTISGSLSSGLAVDLSVPVRAA